MNTSDHQKNTSIGSSALLESHSKDGTADIEAQLTGGITSMDSHSDAGSNDQLVGGTDPEATTTHFTPHGPPSIFETAGCIAFFIFGNTAGLVTLIFNDPHQRPIPVQYLEASGEYVHNGTNNEIYKGETVPTLVGLGICAILPFCIQA
jgi:hypothetical protein